MEIAGVVIINLIACLCLVRGNLHMVGVEHVLGWLYIPQPAGTGAGTVGQLFLPACVTIDIECRIAITIRIDGFTCFGHHAVLTVFLIEALTAGELKTIGLAYFILCIKEVAAVEVNIILHIVSDVDMFTFSKLLKTT